MRLVSFSTLRLFVIFLFWMFAGRVFAAQVLPETQATAKQVWQVLDYLAVDYSKAVRDGKVVSADEYKEMQEFAGTVRHRLTELPEGQQKAQLVSRAQELQRAISDKDQSQEVASQARNLASALLAAYPFPVAPTAVPDLRLGARVYAQQCTACHGATGAGNGPLAAKLSPPPISFTDHHRAAERSVLALQQIINHGVTGTAMPAFAQLSEEERWSVAFFISTLSYSDSDKSAGKKLWEQDKALRTAVPDLSTLSQISESSLAKSLSPNVARGALAYLRSSPGMLTNSSKDTTDIARLRLRESLAAFEHGDTNRASRLALEAYLDGFEPVEPALAAKDRSLFEEIERTMGLYRGAIAKNDHPSARATEAELQSLLTSAHKALGKANEDPLSIYLGALTILLREGVEALLVIVAMIAFLKKAGRSDVVPFVHGGWVVALAAGGVTWMVATYLVNVSGASRELTEGFSALFAAVVLLMVGIWMHQKSLAGRWQAYVRDKLTAALKKPSAALMLFLLAFVTVYREVFETVLFYAALWSDGNGLYLLAGLGSGAILLGIIASVLLRSSARLPIAQFFAASSALVALLAVVLTGKGVAALQKAGVFNTTPLTIPSVDILGLYPSLQTVLAQCIILIIIGVTLTLNKRQQYRPS